LRGFQCCEQGFLFTARALLAPPGNVVVEHAHPRFLHGIGFGKRDAAPAVSRSLREKLAHLRELEPIGAAAHHHGAGDIPHDYEALGTSLSRVGELVPVGTVVANEGLPKRSKPESRATDAFADPPVVPHEIDH
jgi:hypothetical protein